MNKNTIMIVAVIGVALLLTGCDSKQESHFKDGGDLLCIEHNLISDNVTRTVNNSNAYLGRRHKAHVDIEITVTMNDGHLFNHTSFDIDNCEIK